MAIPVPDGLKCRTIHQTATRPAGDGSYVYLDAILSCDEVAQPGMQAGYRDELDSGVNDSMAGVYTDGTTFIVDGRIRTHASVRVRIPHFN